MESSDDPQLGQSRIMLEEVNKDIEPTQEEIIQQANLFAINDLELARWSLVTEIGPEWRPFINRHEQLFYINLEERLGYRQHPIEMTCKIENAMRCNSKVPRFKSYQFEQFVTTMEIVQRELANYERTKDLNIVFEQSFQDSAIKQDSDRQQGRSLKEDRSRQGTPFSLEQQVELSKYRQQLKSKMQSEVEQYRMKQQKLLKSRLQTYERHLCETKDKFIVAATRRLQDQLDSKHAKNNQQQLQTLKDQHDQQWEQLEDLLTKEYDLNYQLHQNPNQTREIQIMFRRRRVAKKTRMRKQAEQESRRELAGLSRKAVLDAMKSFEDSLIVFNGGSQRYVSLLEQEMQEAERLIPAQSAQQYQQERYLIQEYQQERYLPSTRRKPIFSQQISLKKNDHHHAVDREIDVQIENKRMDDKEYQQIMRTVTILRPYTSSHGRNHASLSLKLMKKIL